MSKRKPTLNIIDINKLNSINFLKNYDIIIDKNELEKFPDKDWDWYSISRNPSLTLEWLEKFPDKDWDYSKIYFRVEDVYERKLREYLAAYKIQQWWYMITMSPHYKIGRKFIDRKYSELLD